MSRSSGWLKKLFWIVGIILFVVGVPAWWDRIINSLRDVNFGTIVPWGLWEAGYIYFVGLSAGAFLISSLVYVFGVKRFERIGRLAVFTALVTLLMALILIWAGLGHFERVWHLLVYPNFRSLLGFISWLYMGYFLLLLAELWFLLRRDLVAGKTGSGAKATLYRILSLGSQDLSERAVARDRRVVRVLATIGVPVAIMFHGGVGTLFAVVIARPLWNTGLFPILFLVSALVSGGALLTVIAAVFQDGWTRNRDVIMSLGTMVLALMLLDVLFQVSEWLIALYGQVPGHLESFNLIVRGPYWWVFWGVQVVIGTLVPVLLLALPTRRNPRWVTLAALLITVGFAAVRLNIVVPGLAIEEIRGLSAAVASRRLTTDYFPSLMEWSIAAGVVGLGLLLFGLGELLLPKEEEVGHVPA
jgi:molybdopterin-containing oxidoreductase family membrane subunit